MIFIFLIVLLIFCFCLYSYISNQNNSNTFGTNYEYFQQIKNISIILLSYNRPHNLKHSLSYLINIPFVDEIKVYHGSKEYFDDSFQHEKVQHFHDEENNKKYYTMRRFLHAKDAKNENVLLLDDDLIPKRKLLKKMSQELVKNRNACVGPFGRHCSSRGYYNFGERNIVLTGLVMLSKNVIMNVWEKMQENQEIMDIVMEYKGNGEDLFFQHEFQKLYKQKPTYIKEQDYLFFDKSKGFSTTRPMKHYFFRYRMCRKLHSS